MSKQCGRCRKEWPITDFLWNTSGTRRCRRGTCRHCQAEMRRARKVCSPRQQRLGISVREVNAMIFNMGGARGVGSQQLAEAVGDG